MDAFQDLVVFLLRVARVTLVNLFVLGGPGVLLLYMTSYLSGYVHRTAYRAIGRPAYLICFGWFGTAVHEIAHAVSALFFGHRVVAFRPFTPYSGSNELGSVDVEPRYGCLYSYFGLVLTGLAPTLLGPFVIFTSLYLIFNDEINIVLNRIWIDNYSLENSIPNIISSALSFFAFVFNPKHFLDWRLYLFFYIAFSIGSSINLSKDDTKEVKWGCYIFASILFLFNLVLFSIGVMSESVLNWIFPFMAVVYIILCFVIMLDLLVIAILWLPANLRD